MPGVGTGTGPGHARSARPVSAEFPPHPPTPPRPAHICRNRGPEALDRWPRGPELADSESGHLRCVSKVRAQRPHAQQAAVAGDPAGVPGQWGAQRGLWILPWVGQRPSEGRGRGGRRAPAAGVRVGTGRQEDGLRGVGPEPPSAASLIPARPALHPVGNTPPRGFLAGVHGVLPSMKGRLREPRGGSSGLRAPGEAGGGGRLSRVTASVPLPRPSLCDGPAPARRGSCRSHRGPGLSAAGLSAAH